MRKFIALAVTTGIVAMAVASPALAKIPNPGVVLATINGPQDVQVGDSSSPGDAFYPSAPDSDRRAACEEAGGAVEGNGREWVCVF